MLTVFGRNWKPFPPPTVTSKIVLVADGTPFTAGRPFWSTIRMGGALLIWGMLVCLSPDLACDKNTIANIVASQKVSRNTAFNRFMIYSFSCAPALRIFFNIDTEPYLALCDSA
jgi:hypothetical protein